MLRSHKNGFDQWPNFHIVMLQRNLTEKNFKGAMKWRRGSGDQSRDQDLNKEIKL